MNPIETRKELPDQQKPSRRRGSRGKGRARASQWAAAQALNGSQPPNRVEKRANFVPKLITPSITEMNARIKHYKEAAEVSVDAILEGHHLTSSFRSGKRSFTRKRTPQLRFTNKSRRWEFWEFLGKPKTNRIALIFSGTKPAQIVSQNKSRSSRKSSKPSARWNDKESSELSNSSVLQPWKRRSQKFSTPKLWRRRSRHWWWLHNHQPRMTLKTRWWIRNASWERYFMFTNHIPLVLAHH